MKFWILVIGGSVAVGGIIALASYEDAKDCESRGGVYHCNTSSGYVYGRNGGPTSSTSCECFHKDGTVLLR